MERKTTMWLMLGKNFGVLEIDSGGEGSFGDFYWKIVRLLVIGRLIFKDILKFINNVLLKR